MSGALAIFAGSFLLFLVQPLVGNTLLPAFGGTSSVWVVSLVTFQTLLVAGYFYAHAVAGRFRRGPLVAHVALLLVAAAWAAFMGTAYPRIAGMMGSWGAPALGTLAAVLALAGVPYVLLSANATLMQTVAGGNYRLYAVGNAGSLCGLFAYPFLLEPFLRISRQWQVFACGLGVYALLVVWAVWRNRGVGDTSARQKMQDVESVAAKGIGWPVWLGLGALSCFLLNGVTTHLSSDVTPLALLWTMVLAAYLLSWIVGFTGIGAKLLPVACVITVFLGGAGVWHLGFFGSKEWFAELGLGLSVVFFGGWVVHGGLYGLRPEPARLSVYYLMISLGGALGGLVSALLLPHVFNFVAEYPLALALTAGVSLGMLGARFAKYVPESRRAWIPRGVSLVAVALALWGCSLARSDEGIVLDAERNFHGMVRVMRRWVKKLDGSGYWANVLKNGGTDHGFQLAEGNWKSRIPTMYYGPQAGGLVFERHPKRLAKRPLRAACCGLGVGALAAYAGKGDFLRFFEINPAVARIARDTRYFSFVSGAEGKIDIVLDDARQGLEKERARRERKYDIISVDVFSGDSIPPQMITREAFELYLDRLEDDGILALHVSSWHLDLQPVIKAAAKHFKLQVEGFYCEGEAHTYFSSWVFLSRKPIEGFFDKMMHIKVDYGKVRDVALPEDDWHPLVHLLSFVGVQR